MRLRAARARSAHPDASGGQRACARTGPTSPGGAGAARMRAVRPSPRQPPSPPPPSAARARALPPPPPPIPGWSRVPTPATPALRARSRSPARSSFPAPPGPALPWATALRPHLSSAPASRRPDPPCPSVPCPAPPQLGERGIVPSPRSDYRAAAPALPRRQTRRRAGASAVRPVSAAWPRRPGPRSRRAPRRALGWEPARCVRRAAPTDLPRPPGRGRAEAGSQPRPPPRPWAASPRSRPPGGPRRGGEPPEGPRRPRPQVRRGPRCDRVQPRSPGGTSGEALRAPAGGGGTCPDGNLFRLF